ncbi:YcaO-like family protein [Rubrivirga sp. IMCC43871]|uniref:YcaO-like family protein n=1 Tax=Rubrivirga sp. IMCC43871 TaxID=3391575 RepID=UPI00398FF8A8
MLQTPIRLLGDPAALPALDAALAAYGFDREAGGTPVTVRTADAVRQDERGHAPPSGPTLVVDPRPGGLAFGVFDDPANLSTLAHRLRLRRPGRPAEGAPSRCLGRLGQADSQAAARAVATYLAVGHAGLAHNAWVVHSDGRPLRSSPLHTLPPQEPIRHPLRRPRSHLRTPLGLLDPEIGIAYRARVVAQIGPAVAAAVRYRFPIDSDDPTAIIANECHAAGGKAWNPAVAVERAIWEAAERLSGTRHPDIALRRDSRTALGERALDLDAIDLFSDRQRARRTTGGPPEAYVTTRLDPHRVIDWVRAWPINESDLPRWVPAAAAFYGYSRARHPYAFAHSNGCAGGASYTDAALGAILELIERDIVSSWFFNRIPRPAARHTSSRVEGVRGALLRDGRDLHVLDLTADLKVPVCAAVSCRRSGPPGWVLGFAAGRTLDEAAEGAVLELVQMIRATDDPRHPSPLTWADTASPRDHPYLLPADATAVITRPLGPDPLQDLSGRLATAGIDAYLVDQTHPLVGTPVVRALAPGLAFFWRRLGGRRLYRLPVEVGWSETERLEADLNPLDLFL